MGLVRRPSLLGLSPGSASAAAARVRASTLTAPGRTSLIWVPGPRQMVAWSPCGVEVSLRTRPAASEPWNCSAMSGICWGVECSTRTRGLLAR